MDSQGGFFISQIKPISDRIWTKLLHAGGLEAFNGPQGRLLYVLWQQDGISAAELARRSGLAPTTLTTMLDRLQAAGLVRREAHETDRRRWRLKLTDRARELMASSQRISNEMTDIYYRGFSQEEAALFEALLRRLLKNLQDCERIGPAAFLASSEKQKEDENDQTLTARDQ